MDSTDVRIFCEMAFRGSSLDRSEGRGPSPADIGRKLKLDEKTVRARVRHMEDSGFIKYYQASPSLALFGMKVVSDYRLEALNLMTKRALVESLNEVPRLVESSDYFGNSITASIAGASSGEARAVADRLAAHYELGVKALGTRTIRNPSTSLDALDWKIVRQLRYDARSSDKELAQALEVTQRMIGYRTSKLIGSGAVGLRAVIDPQRQAGLIFYELELLVEPPRSAEVLKWFSEAYSQRVWSVVSPSPEIILASLFSFTFAEPEESVLEALAREGVRRCSLYILKEVMEPKKPNWIDSLIQLRLGS